MADPAGVVLWAGAALVFGPLLGAVVVYLLPGRRFEARLCLALSAAALVPLAGLSATVFVHGVQEFTFGGHATPLGIAFSVDGLALAMLWLTGLVMFACHLYVTGWLPGESGFRAGEFRALVLLLWGGLNALFCSADLFNLYVTLEIVSLIGVALVVFARGAGALRAALRYLLFALTGSLFYLLGVALIYADTGVLSFAELRAAAPAGGTAAIALAAMTAGLAVKAALFPVHAWLPPAHAAAPSPASALLSALVAKAAAYLLIRLWLGPFAALGGPGLLQGLGAVGLAGIVYASVQALRQTRLKGVIAYSTVAQLGYFLLLLPMASLAAWQGVAYHGLSHGLAKAALFLAAGNLIRVAGSDRLEDLGRAEPLLGSSLLAMALAGVSLAGLPPSGGFVGKWWLIQAALESGQWWWAAGIAAGGLLGAAYVFRVLRHALSNAPAPAQPGTLTAGMVWSPVLLAVAAFVLGFTGNILAPLLAVGAPGSGS
ncbi:MAG: proton-conducting transporter membrane subunit [Halioglobus sp.]|nr:proton-conducting transporter membrane subunit [Halioglobus sp.]